MGELWRDKQHLMQILDSENSDSRPEQTPQQETIVSTESTSWSSIRSGCVSAPPNWLIADPHLEHLRLLERVGCTHVGSYHVIADIE